MTVPDYEWLESGERPGAWMAEASCFTFLRGMSVADVVERAGFPSTDELDLTSVADAAERFGDQGIAVFDTDEGWTIIYQDNGFPEQFANLLLAMPTAEQGVVVFWNVNALTEFSYWERGQLVTSFDDPDQRHGSDPDRFLDDILDLDLVLDEAEGFVDLQYAKMMALAERITGVRLGSDFLQRRVVASRVETEDDPRTRAAVYDPIRNITVEFDPPPGWYEASDPERHRNLGSES